MLIGELLVAQGFVTVADTELALAHQKNYGGRIGENFIAGLITKSTLDGVLRKQHELALVVLNYENSVAKAKQIHGSVHPETNRQRFYLARALIAAGNPAEAVDLAQTALAGHEAALAASILGQGNLLNWWPTPSPLSIAPYRAINQATFSLPALIDKYGYLAYFLHPRSM